VDHTAENAYYGQAGIYILRDDHERNLGLPDGKYDVPLILTAKFYNSDGTLWDPEANGETTSVFGDVIQVNGAPWPYFEVEPRKYRFRVLNTGISRTYKLYMEEDTNPGTKLDFTVIGSDTGLLEKSVPTTDLYISVAERWEIVVDFSKYAGKKLTLKNSRGVGADSDFDGTDRVMRKSLRYLSSYQPAHNCQNSASAKRTPSPALLETVRSQTHFARFLIHQIKLESTTAWYSSMMVACGTSMGTCGLTVLKLAFSLSLNEDRLRFGS
jgi:FtsP/CotA-like multicopper oxidase with cupredoxin domain